MHLLNLILLSTHNLCTLPFENFTLKKPKEKKGTSDNETIIKMDSSNKKYSYGNLVYDKTPHESIWKGH